MIQRIQSIWLLLASLSLLALFLFPYIQMSDDAGIGQTIRVTGVYKFIGGQEVKTQEFIVLTIALVILALAPIAIIFKFRDRKKQITFCYLLILAILGYSFWLVQTTKSVIGLNTQIGLQNYGIGVIIPSIAILFIILALIGIRKDEKLIKSADRLR